MSDGDPDETASGDPDSDPEASEQRETTSDGDAPLSELADRVGRRRRDRSDGDPPEPTADLDPDLPDGPPPDPDEDPFEQMSVGEIDEEALWSSLGSDEPAGVGVDTASDAAPLGGVGPASGVESVGDARSGAEEHVVPKDKYCQSCPYLEEPPELACTHEGTEIVEVVDSERFRVRNCPVVEGGVEPTE